MSGRLLVVYSNSANYVATTAEYLSAFAKHSSWDVRYLHVTHDAEPDVDLSEYDAVLQSYCVRPAMDGYVPDAWMEKFKAFAGVKAVAIQDEYDRVNRTLGWMRDVGVDVVLTSVPQADVHRIYPEMLFPETRFVPVLTGYVPEHLPKRNGGAKPLKDRPVVVGYRGRDVSPRYGRLGYDKLEIGRRMKAVCLAEGIPHDIAWTEQHRLYGDEWYRWIASCRVNLATESGSNAFDWNGEIEREYARCAAAAPDGRPDWDSFLEWLAPKETGVQMGQISPRIFEAAAMRTALVCFPGSYSGILRPNEHYIPLERDFSNVADVLRRIGDTDALERMVTDTWFDLIGSEQFTYQRFIGKVDAALADVAERKGVPRRGALASRDYPPPLIDSVATRSLAERPTREPNPPLLFAFKHLARETRRYREALARQMTLTEAMERRLREDSERHAREVDEARLAAVKAAERQPGISVGVG